MATILVVDDEFGIAELIEAILTDAGHRVLSAINGREGFELLNKEHPDLVLLDLMMPVMDGAAMLREMAGVPALGGVPVVMMSSMPETVIAERCSGYAAFLRKPFRVAQIVGTVKRLLGTGVRGGAG